MCTWLLRNANTEKVYINESGFHLWIRRTKGRSARGQPVFRIVNARQSKHMSTIFAVSSERGLLHHAFKEGGYNGAAFKEFLEECSRLLVNHEVVFIFDNAPSHNSAATAHLQPNHSYRFQPPYSPFLNICEGSFSIWKAAFKRFMADVRHHLLLQAHQERLATMMQLAEQAIADVTREKIHCLY